MTVEYTNLLTYVDDALAFAKCIPRHWSKFSNKIYCNHQKLAIYVLMQKLKQTTRGIVSILRSSEELRLHLGLDDVPVHTTIVRFAKRIESLIPRMLGIRKAGTVAIDSTGFSLENRSAHYEKILEHQNIRLRRRSVKLSIATETMNHDILSFAVHLEHSHDTKDFKALLEGVHCDHVVADKGYDSHDLRRHVVYKVKARPHIPYRNFGGPPRNLRKKFLLDPKIYHQRSIVENVFFCMKQKFGSVLRNRTPASQTGEVIAKVLAHNLDRLQARAKNIIYLGLHQRRFIVQFITSC